MSPFFVERGREPLVPLDIDKAVSTQNPRREDTQEFLARMWNIEEQVREKLAIRKESMAQFYDTHKGRPAVVFEPGDKVWLSTKGITMPWDKERKSKKLTAKFYGPFPVIRQTSPVTYELDLPQASNIHPIMHVSLLKPYSALTEREGHVADDLPNADENEYEIESILAHRTTKGGQKKYLVKWKGYTFEESTWEPPTNFKGNALKKYHAKIKEEREEASTSDDEESVMTMKAVERKAPIDKHTTSSNGPATGANAIPIDNPPPETDIASGMDCDE